jgi:AcrR family transcriptional regulator
MPTKAKRKSDRRTQRTRRKLSSAMVGLIKEKRFDDITVQNVIDRADVARGTFYSHFTGTGDLFDQQWQDFNRMLAEKIDWNKAGKDSFVPVTFFFQHLQDSQDFYQGLVRSRKVEAIFKSGVEYLSRNIERSLDERLKDRRIVIPIPIVANYLASEFFALLKWWLDAGMPYKPGDMDKIFHDLVNPTIAEVLRPGKPTPSFSR